MLGWRQLAKVYVFNLILCGIYRFRFGYRAGWCDALSAEANPPSPANSSWHRVDERPVVFDVSLRGGKLLAASAAMPTNVRRAPLSRRARSAPRLSYADLIRL